MRSISRPAPAGSRLLPWVAFAPAFLDLVAEPLPARPRLGGDRVPLTLDLVVGAAAAGREVHDELDRIGRGERPADHEVQRQWDQVTAEARSRWQTLRESNQERRRKQP